MANTKNNGNGRVDRLEEAMTAFAQQQTALAQQQTTLGQAQANLLQALANMAQNQTAMAQQQTAFLARMAETDTQIREINARMVETDRINSERFARIEAILLDHSCILRALPEAVREKIGFKIPHRKLRNDRLSRDLNTLPQAK